MARIEAWNTGKTGTGNRNSFGFCCWNILRGYENILDPKLWHATKLALVFHILKRSTEIMVKITKWRGSMVFEVGQVAQVKNPPPTFP